MQDAVKGRAVLVKLLGGHVADVEHNGDALLLNHTKDPATLRCEPLESSLVERDGLSESRLYLEQLLLGATQLQQSYCLSQTLSGATAPWSNTATTVMV